MNHSIKKIGVIGAGRIGSTLARLWAAAGHEVRLASRHPESLASLAANIGARAATPEEAAGSSDVLLIALPFGAVREVGAKLGADLRGKVVLETSNPYPARDGAIAEEVLRSGRGTGPVVAEWLPGARLVRAFNTVWDRTLAEEAHRAPPRIGIPLASDDAEALEIAADLVKDAGFDPVIVGRLDQSRRFDTGTAVYNTGMDGASLRAALGIAAVSTPLAATDA
jgi:8-hydroxy-5-deazaflavin:NADPH oxidoreductase